MNEYQKASGIVRLHGAINSNDTPKLLNDFITDRLNELKTVGVTPGKTQSERDTNSGAYLELSNFIDRLDLKCDDARELLKADNSAKGGTRKTTGG